MVLGLDSGILVMATLVAIVALVAFVNMVVIPEAGSWFLDALVKMPKFDYKFQGGEQGNESFLMYRNLRTVAFLIIAIALTYSAVVLIGEEFEVYRKGEAFSMLSKGLLFVIVIFTFPAIWDLFASGIEGLAKYVLNPENPNQANKKVQQLIQMIGGIVPPNFDWTLIINGLTDPNSFQGFFRDVFLAVFKAFIAALLMFLMFVIGTIRLVLTGVLAIAIPLILSISLVPYLNRVMDRLKDVLVGLSIAPVLSALAVSAGLALINSTNFTPLQQWLASISVALLAVAFPVIVAPMLGSIVSTATTVMTGGMIAGTLLAGSAVTGAVQGAVRGVQSAIATGVMSPIGLARSAISGAGSGLQRGLEAGVLYSATEAVKSMGFGKLAEPMYKVQRIAERRLAESGLDTAEGIATGFTGSVTEGLLPSLVLKTNIPEDRIPRAVEEATKFNSRIQELADKGKYEEIADLANEYLKFRSIPNKRIYGQMFAEQMQAYSKNPVALAKVYAGLKHIQEEGGVTAQDTDTLAGLIHFRDPLRALVQEKYGIEIPNPEFELSDVRKPEELPTGATVIAAYPVKYTIANVIQNAEAIKSTATPEQLLEYKETGKELIGDSRELQAIVDKRIGDIMNQRYGIKIDKDKDNTAKSFVDSLSTSITQDLLARDPETLGAIHEILSEDEKYLNALVDLPDKELIKKTDQLLPNVHIQKMWREAKSQIQTQLGNSNSTDNRSDTVNV